MIIPNGSVAFAFPRVLACGDDCLQQAAGPFPVLAACELDGDEVGHPGVGEGHDLRRDRVLVPDDRHVAGAGRALPSSIAR